MEIIGRGLSPSIHSPTNSPYKALTGGAYTYYNTKEENIQCQKEIIFTMKKLIS